MPDEPRMAPMRDRPLALAVVCVLALVSVVIAFLGVPPGRVSASEMLGTSRAPGDSAFVASHRGDSATAPENTLPAVTAAIEAGFEYVEVDVRLTADRVPVLMHDAAVDRTTDGHGAVADLTFDELRGLDAGAWFDSHFRGTPVPAFTGFLDVIESMRGRALVELKGEWDAAAVAGLIAEVSTRGLERRIAVASFDVGTLALVAAESDVIARLGIFRELPEDVVAAVVDIDVRGIIVERREIDERPHVVEELQAEGVRVVVYTLNEDVHWEDAEALGVDGIVTDDPAALARWQVAAADRP